MDRSTTSPRSHSARTETDSFGPIEVAADRYWGAQTERSRQNFRIGHDRMPIEIIRALGIVKLAATQANPALGLFDPRPPRALLPPAPAVTTHQHPDHIP